MPTNEQKFNGIKLKPMSIAIVGIGAIFPGSDHASGFWRDILSGRDLVREVPPTHWIIEDHYHADPSAPDKTYCKRGAFLSPTDFDPLEFKIPPANLSSIDTSQLLGLKVAKQVLDDVANEPLGHTARDRVSVILGVASGLELLGEMNSRLQRPMWAKALEESGIPDDQTAAICDRIANQYTPWRESTFPGLLGNVVAGRIANHFDLGGTNCTVDAACASSFSAMSMAVNELRLGLADLVITGGVDTTNGPFLHTCFSKTPALSLTGDCRPFSDKADGVVIGEGIGMVALKRLDDAERNGDRIYAVIRGIGTSSDGAGKSVFSPRCEGQEKVLRRCYDIAGYSPGTVTLVEAHGTGTVTGDRVEFEALRRVFDGKDGKKRQWCALGSIKSQIGHTKSAAGVAGLIKTVMALHNRVLAPTIKVDRPDDRLDLANSPFYLNTKARPWITNASHPPRASVSAFGFGGTNFHVAVEAYTGPGKKAWRQRAFPCELILLDAGDEAGLLAKCKEMADQAQTTGMLTYIAQSSQKTFNPTAPARMAIVANDEKDLEQKIDRAISLITEKSGQTRSCRTGIHYCLSAAQSGALAFLFPGHSSQYTGMGADPAMHLTAAREIWEMAAAIPMEDELRLHEIVFPRPVFNENDEKAQQEKINLSQWAQPATSTMSLSLLAVLERFGIKPDCVGGQASGEMTAICAAGVIDAANLIKLVRKQGERLTDNAPYLAHLNAVPFNAPDCPIYANIDAVPYPDDEEKMRLCLSSRVDQPDRIEEVIEAMYTNGVRMFVEVGPGSMLTERVGRCLGHRPHMVVSTDRQGDNGITRLWNALGLLAIHGRTMDFSQMWDGYAPMVDPRLKQTSMFSVPLMGCNYDRPYPPQAGAVERTPRKIPKTTMDKVANNSSRPSSEQFETEKTAMTLKTKPESDHPPKASTGSPAKYPQAHDTTILSHDAPPYMAPSSSKETGRRNAWIDAFVEIQKQTAETHTTFQKSLTDSHMAFLKTAEASTRALSDLITGDDPHPTQIDWSENAPEVSPQRQPVPTPLYHPPMASLSPKPMTLEDPEQKPKIEPKLKKDVPESPPKKTKVADPGAVQVSTDTIPEPDDAPLPVSPPLDLHALLFDVVAQKTGYPSDVLNVDLNLESDLGIDSIKRVEILSAITDQLPELPEVDTALLAELQTLGDVLGYMQQISNNSSNEPSSKVSPQVQPVDDPTTHEQNIELDRYALREVPAPCHGISIADRLHTGFCAVTDDGTGIAQALARHLTDMGTDARVVEEVPHDANSVIFMGGLRNCPDPASALAVNREAFSVAQKVSHRFSTSGGLFVTVQDTGGDFGLSGKGIVSAWLAGLPGLIKTAAIEWPHATVKTIDLERSGRSPDESAQAISKEIFDGGPEIEVGLHADGIRTRLESYPTALEHRYPMMDEKSVIVVSGGARGVTAAALVQLADRFRPKIALLGRTVLNDEPACCRGTVTEEELKRAFLQMARSEGQPALPAQIEQSTRHILAQREIRSTLQALKAAGSEACYFNVDIRDATAVGAALSQARRKWGPITGIIHGAGVIKDKPITEKTQDMFDMVFDTKVLGLRSLLTATAGDPLEMICLFSSVAARLGNLGQCDYAMANEVLNKVAQAEARRRNHTCVVKSINWGPWEGGMVSGALRAHFEQAGVPLIPLEVGARTFVDEIQAAPSDAVEVAIVRDPDLPGLEQGKHLDDGLRQ